MSQWGVQGKKKKKKRTNPGNDQAKITYVLKIVFNRYSKNTSHNKKFLKLWVFSFQVYFDFKESILIKHASNYTCVKKPIL